MHFVTHFIFSSNVWNKYGQLVQTYFMLCCSHLIVQMTVTECFTVFIDVVVVVVDYVFELLLACVLLFTIFVSYSLFIAVSNDVSVKLAMQMPFI